MEWQVEFGSHCHRIFGLEAESFKRKVGGQLKVGGHPSNDALNLT